MGPKADGSIPEGDKKILKDLGDWMKVNGSAICGAKVWRKSEEGPTGTKEGQFQDQQEKIYTEKDFRFTVKGDSIYVFSMHYPADGTVCIRALAESANQDVPEFHGIIEDVSILGFAEKPEWKVTTEGLELHTQNVKSRFPVVIRVKVE